MMAANYQSSKETTNFARICRVVIDVIPDLLRDLLITRLPVSGLSAVLTNQKGQMLNVLNKLKFTNQKNILYPQGGVYQGSVKDLDTSLLYFLLRNIGNIPAHQKGWGKEPDIADRSLSANIDRLRIQRNESFAHVPNASLSDGDFQVSWAIIRQSVEDIQNGELKTGSFVVAIDHIFTMEMDNSRMSHKYILDLISSMKDDVGAIKDDVSTVKDDVSTVKDDVSTVKDDVSTVKDDVSTVKDDVSTVRDDVGIVKDDVGTVKDNVGTVKEEVGTVKDVVSTVKEDVSTVKDDISTIKDDISTVKEDVSTVKDDVSTVKEDVSTVKEDVCAVKEDVSTVKDNVCAVKEDVSTVKLDVGTVRADVSSMKDTLTTLSTGTRHVTDRGRKLTTMIDITKKTVRDQTSRSEIISTQALEDAKEVIRNNSMVVIKGASGDGKTMMCYQLLKWLMDGHNENTGLSKDPLQLDHDDMSKWDDFVKPEAQIALFIDDISGDIVEKLERRKDSIQSVFCGKMNSRSNCLILNVRNDIYNSKLMSSCDPFNVKNTVDLRGKNIMTSKEKLQILEKYVPNIKELSGGKESEIVKLAPNIGFPQCCRLYRDVPSLRNEGMDFFKKPFDFMGKTLKKGYFASLLFLLLNDGSVTKRDLDPNSEKIDKEKLDIAFHGIELSYEEKVRLLRKSLGEMFRSLVAKTKYSFWYDDDDDDDDGFYKFCHDSVQDTVALLYGSDTKIGFIENCPKKFLCYLSTSKNTPNRIVISSSNEDMYKRLLREFESVYRESYRFHSRYSRYHSITSLDVWTDVQFLRGFIRWLSGQKVDWCHVIKLRLLNEACCSGLEECALFLLSKGVEPDKETPFCVVKGGSVSLLRKLLEYDVTLTARADMSLSSYYTGNINVLQEACLWEREEMVTVLYNTDPHLVHDTDNSGQSALHFVAQTGNCDIFKTLERFILKSLCRVEDEQHKCERVEGGVVHRNCVCAQYMSGLVDELGKTVLHFSCERGHREVCRYLCETYPTLTTAVDGDGRHCLHHIARCWWSRGSDLLDMFIECETHVKQYLESTGHKYDITTILTDLEESVLDIAKEVKERLGIENYPLYDHLVQLFGQDKH